MSLRGRQDSRSGILSLSWNQDDSCLAIGTQEGLVIFNLESHKICYRLDIGAIGLVEMLYCTSLVGYVGAGEQPALSPRRLTLYNSAACKAIHDMSFTSTVLAVRINRQRLVVVLEQKAYVYCLTSLELLRCIDTAPNPSGVAALCSCSDASVLLALPASNTTGTLRVYNILVEEGSVLCEIEAHRTPVKCAAWSHDGTLLASASQKGTVIRVHRMPEGKKVFSFRRGSYAATVYSLSFSPNGVEPPILAVAGSHGSIHIFKLDANLDDSTRQQQIVQQAQPMPATASGIMGWGGSMMAQAATGLASAVIKYANADLVEPARHLVKIELPAKDVPFICTILPPCSKQTSTECTAEGRGEGDLAIPSTSFLEGDLAKVLVASLDGLLYEYMIGEEKARLPGAAAVSAPSCSLHGEWTLLGSLPPK